MFNAIPTTRRWPGLGLAAALALAFLAACAWATLQETYVMLAGHKVAGTLKFQRDWGWVLPGRLLVFASALIAIHLAAGLAAWLLFRLTLLAWPRAQLVRPGLLLTLWFAVLVIALLCLNTALYPASRLAGTDTWMAAQPGGWPVGYWLSGLIAAATIVMTGTALLHHPARRSAGIVLPVAALCLLPIVPLGSARTAGPALPATRPHLVIIGLDSLRDDLAHGSRANDLTPHISRFLAGAHRFSDAITPLPRTYGSWVTILSGQHPVTSNARFNLMPRELVGAGATLGHALGQAGYGRIYATDEVRFANIDQSFGFDQVITPPVGASDFLLGHISDFPLVNLVSSSPVGEWLFPAVYANRAAHVTYRPGDFVARLEREVVIDRPNFLAIHLTLAHWPYSWAGRDRPTTPPQYRDAYQLAIAELDRQFAAVLQLLEQKGVLDNAVVVMLSDHGEALGYPDDTMLRQVGSGEDIWNSIWGHGTSVMSPHQYGVVLAFRAFGRASLPGTPQVHDWPVSLEDIRPTLEELATGQAPARSDGVSLLRYLADPAAAATLGTRIRFTETGFNTPLIMAGKISASGLVDEGAAYYEMIPDSGWIQLRRDRLPELLARKQRAALSGTALLAALPSWTDGSVSYLYTSRRSPLPRALASRPDPQLQPEAARLWDALHERFAGELPPPAGPAQL